MSTRKLHVGHGFHLPLEAATETFLIVGKRGSGKSSTATRFAEQLIDARIPIAVLDPVDVWWGLKAGADGQREGGKELYVFGGRHADLPLEPTAGELMADVLVDHRINAVMVLREFSNREKAQFVAPFADRLYRRNTEVLHLFAEEAHELMPQQVVHYRSEPSTAGGRYISEEEMLGRMLRLQKLGRSSGIGMTSITQRPASLNKNATTQAEILIAHRLIGPQDIQAIEGWIKHHHQEALKQQVLSTLPELKTGETWIWAPDFPEEHPLGLQRLRILKPETFDSRRTPKPGEKRAEPTQLAPVDLEKLGKKMVATRERVKANDPTVLRAELARLRAEVARKTQVAVPQLKTERIEIPVMKPEDLTRIEHAVATVQAAAKDIRDAMSTTLNSMTSAAERIRIAALATPRPAVIDPRPRVSSRSGPDLAKLPPGRADAGTVGKGERLVLAAVAQYPEGTSRERLTVLTGYKRSTRDTYLQRLQTTGYVSVDQGMITATPHGIAALGEEYRPLPIGQALQDHWMQRLPEGERKILEVLTGAYPQSVARDAISEATGYARSSRDTYLQRLKARGLIKDQGRSGVRATEILFEDSAGGISP